MNDLVERGKKAAQDAIRQNNAEHLARCIKKLKKIGATVEDIYTAIADCPIGLFEQTGLRVNIHSEVVGQEVCLGEKSDWATIRGFLQSGKPDRSTLKAFLSKQTVGETAPAPEPSTASLFD